ncbi:MAG: hypothetical protein Q8O34_11190 [Rhodocyclaceae bacterium]|nr:hypothetical protein [Rhodocyclaceae bacterium]
MGLFSRGIDVESGIVFAEGWFRSGTRPSTGRPTAEIYAVTDKDDPLELWWLVQQEILSRTPRWKDDYFQIWAEGLAIDNAGSVFASDLWVIVVFDPTGKLVTRVDYWPVFAGGVMDDVAYADATTKLGK